LSLNIRYIVITIIPTTYQITDYVIYVTKNKHLLLLNIYSKKNINDDDDDDNNLLLIFIVSFIMK